MAKKRKFLIQIQSNRTGEVFEYTPFSATWATAVAELVKIIKEGFDPGEDMCLQLNKAEEVTHGKHKV